MESGVEIGMLIDREPGVRGTGAEHSYLCGCSAALLPKKCGTVSSSYLRGHSQK